MPECKLTFEDMKKVIEGKTVENSSCTKKMVCDQINKNSKARAFLNCIKNRGKLTLDDFKLYFGETCGLFFKD